MPDIIILFMLVNNLKVNQKFYANNILCYIDINGYIRNADHSFIIDKEFLCNLFMNEYEIERIVE